MSLKNCPDCGSDLGRSAMKCRCGWKASAVMHTMQAACAHSGCQTPSLVRMKVKTGWANLCEFHYVEEHRNRSAKWCADNGLHTTQQKIEFCRTMAGRVLKPMVDREPGQDDEELAA